MLPTLTALLALALLIFLAAITEGRYRRSRRRMTRLERTTAEQLLMLKPMYARHATARLAAAGRSPARPVEFRSQFGEDILLHNLFDTKRDGYFIEVGAYDGYTYAVTYAFECL